MKIETIFAILKSAFEAANFRPCPDSYQQNMPIDKDIRNEILRHTVEIYLSRVKEY